MADIIAWHGRDLHDHKALRDQWAAQGYRFLTLSIYGPISAPIYAAVMIKRATVVEQHDRSCMTADEWQQAFNTEAALGFGPVIVAATGSANDPRFAAVFQPMATIPLTKSGLTSGDISDPGTIQGMNSDAKQQGFILQCAASYGDSNNANFAAIWMPNKHNTLWNNDGLLDDAATCEARLKAETSAWCRPAFLTLNADNCYMTLFVADEIGAWVVRHNMTPARYQSEFDTWTAQNYFPICVQAAGATATSARFAALFVQSETVIPKRFRETGPVANAGFAPFVKQIMATSPVARHASLAIVSWKKLVYARGYTYAEPDWPVVQPTTCFRLASVSKTITALAVYKQIEAGNLALSDTLQSILQLETPAGKKPLDGRFNLVTIQQLLEHTSGINSNGASDGVAVVNAFTAAGGAGPLPVTQAMTDSYIASLWFVNDPGTTQVYNNCGYYLLGRVVAKLLGTTAPIDAYTASI